LQSEKNEADASLLLRLEINTSWTVRGCLLYLTNVQCQEKRKTQNLIKKMWEIMAWTILKSNTSKMIRYRSHGSEGFEDDFKDSRELRFWLSTFCAVPAHPFSPSSRCSCQVHFSV